MIPLSLRFAGRELRSGVRGFRVFLACLALGVAAIAAAGSTAEAFRQGLASQASEILGGDIAVGIEQRTFTAPERVALERLGGVSADYPLVGQVTLSGGMRLADAVTPVGDAEGVTVEQPLLDRLGLKLGDRFMVGNVPVVARAVLLGEPDQLSRGFALGPKVLARFQIMPRGGFFTPGLPVAEMARISLRPGVSLREAHHAVTA